MFYFLRDLSLMLIPDDERNATQAKHNQGGAACTKKNTIRPGKAGYHLSKRLKNQQNFGQRSNSYTPGRVVAVREGSSAIFNFNWRQAIQRGLFFRMLLYNMVFEQHEKENTHNETESEGPD